MRKQETGPTRVGGTLLIACLVAGIPALADPPAAPAAESETAAPPAPRLSRLGGRAYLGRNRPVVGATVLVTRQDSSDRQYVASTDAGGEFRVDDLESGTYRVRVEREGLTPRAKDKVTLQFPFRAVVELAMEPLAGDRPGSGFTVPEVDGAAGPVVVRGRVFEAGVGAVGQVRLRFVRVDGSEDPRVVRSAPDGRFEVAGIGSGAWRLETSGVGFLSQRLVLAFEGDTDLEVLLVRQPADYDPSPLELMPAEQPVPPPGLLDPPLEDRPAEPTPETNG